MLDADSVADGKTEAPRRWWLVQEVPVESPEWTDFNDSDPGVTLVELFTFLADTLLWQIDERKRRRRRHFAFLVVCTAGIGLFLCRRRPQSG